MPSLICSALMINKKSKEHQTDKNIHGLPSPAPLSSQANQHLLE